MLPWEQPSSGSGYFEIIKGPPVDTKRGTFNRDANATSTLVGYTQDVLMFTTRSRDVPFTGRFLNQTSTSSNLTTIEAQVAEVVWYMLPTYNAQGQPQYLDLGTKTPIYTLYRRQFLVYPSPVPARAPAGTAHPLLWFYDIYDISAHPDGNGNMIANSLSDLSYREFRFAHNNFAANNPAPYLVLSGSPVESASNYDNDADGLMPFQPPYSPNGAANPVGSQRYGEDVALTNVLSFDVKVWDPGAEVQVDTAGHPLVPSDPGYDKSPGTQTRTNFASPPSPPHFNPPQFGAYVDLNYTSTTYSSAASGDTDGFLISGVKGRPDSYFAGPYYGSGSKLFSGATKGLWAGHFTLGFATYDSWSQGYEFASNSVNGFDNDNSNGVNDASERVTSPPYPVPLRGVQIKIRVYEPTSRQVREVTVTETFLPD
jgi:hypothetical protein